MASLADKVRQRVCRHHAVDAWKVDEMGLWLQEQCTKCGKHASWDFAIPMHTLKAAIASAEGDGNDGSEEHF